MLPVATSPLCRHLNFAVILLPDGRTATHRTRTDSHSLSSNPHFGGLGAGHIHRPLSRGRRDAPHGFTPDGSDRRGRFGTGAPAALESSQAQPRAVAASRERHDHRDQCAA